VLADAGAIRITHMRASSGDQTERAHVHAFSYFVLEGELALSAGVRELRAPWVEWRCRQESLTGSTSPSR
jgi:hypothetical protein